MRKIAIVLLALSVGGCAKNITMTEAIGAAGGAAIGGFVGSHFGGGLFQTLFTGTGALAGGVSGFVAARKMMQSDMVLYENTAQKGLAHAGDGQVLNWLNPETGRSGIFRATRSFVSAQGRYCRTFRTTIAFDDGLESGDGTACETASGTWQILSNDMG
ncbi:MAG: hypothetical protein CFH05_00940 [Alphaproteobacteria bacterium MarineAlpha3_Bin4]|nr:MAG: hypothetical protein CFH05_00940 [Alphaproteobacteria bacterium MarineAlpha3_Bin4]